MELKEYKLSELLEIKNGRDHQNLSDGQYPVYGSGGIMRYADSYLYDKPSILLPRKGSLTNIQYCEIPFWTVDTTYYTVVDDTLANPYYLYRYLSLLDLSRLDSGTGVPSMTFDSYYNIKVKLPDITIQQNIAAVLQNLDMKIKLNRLINRNLEALAKQLYDYWFVQFDFPDEQGKPYKSSGGKMVWSEELKCLIPSTFTIENLISLDIYNSDYTANGSFAGLAENVVYNEGEKYALLLRVVDFNNNFSNQDKFVYINKHGYDYLKSCHLEGDEIIICNVGNAGATFRCPPLDMKMALGPNGIVVNNAKWNNYLYMYYISALGQHLIKGISSGSIQLKFNKTSFRNLPIYTPPTNVLELFDAKYSLINEQRKNLWLENRELKKQRDELLQLLMNGQVSLNSDLSSLLLYYI